MLKASGGATFWHEGTQAYPYLAKAHPNAMDNTKNLYVFVKQILPNFSHAISSLLSL